MKFYRSFLRQLRTIRIFLYEPQNHMTRDSFIFHPGSLPLRLVRDRTRILRFKRRACNPPQPTERNARTHFCLDTLE